MIETYIVIGTVIGALSGLLWKTAYENGKLKELVKQMEAEIKRLKRDMRDWD